MALIESKVDVDEVRLETCAACLQVHAVNAVCKCAVCGCGVHRLFLCCAVMAGQRLVLCPTCDEARFEHFAALGVNGTPDDLRELLATVAESEAA